MSAKEARRILGLSRSADSDEIRAKADKLLRASAHPERKAWRYGDESTKNLVLIKILEAREVLLKERAEEDRRKAQGGGEAP